MGQPGLPPGFRFSPTDEELVMHYLKNRACGKDFHQGVIADVDIYKHEPWDLPEMSALPSADPVWYFFNAQDKRHSHTARINRITSKGYWKATGKDRKVCCGPHTVGIKKTLIYYEGRAPSGKRTDWIMHEYKLDEEFENKSKVVCAATLCRIRKKGGPGPRNGEQYGAPVFHENNEGGDDAEDDVDEKLPILPESRCEPSAPSLPKQFKDPKVQGEKVFHDMHKEGCGSNDFSSAEGLGTNMELDWYAYLESFLSNDAEAASLEPEMVSSIPVLDKQIPLDILLDIPLEYPPTDIPLEYPMDLYALSEIESLLDLDGKNVHDILHPTCGEKQILGELLHLADGGQCHTSNGDSDARIISQPSVHSGSILNSEDVVPSGVAGDFIELEDMHFPLDGFVMRSPLQGSYYNVHDDQSPHVLFDGVETFGWSPDVLHTQGSATRRARLQIVPPSANRTHVDMLQQIEAVHNLHPEVQRQEGSIDTNIQIVTGTFNADGQRINSSSGSGSDLDDIANAVEFSPKSCLSKHVSFYTVAKCEEVSPQMFFTATAESQDEDAGLDPTIGSTSKHVNSRGCINDAGLDCEAGSDPLVLVGATSKHSSTSSLHSDSVIRKLVSKVKSLTLGSGMGQLESSLSTTFNDKVFALGKPVAQLLPSRDYVNPYHSLRRGAMASLCRLALAVLLLFFLFLGIHMLTKYVLSLAA